MYRAVHNGSQSDRHRARRFVRGLPCRCACMAIFGMCTMHVILTWWPRVADLTSGLNATRSPSNAPPPSRLVHGARHGALFVQGRLVITSRRIDAAAGSCRRIDAPPPPVAPPPTGDSIDTAAESSTTPLRIDFAMLEHIQRE